jgi:two-component system sensor histidine kinase BaeS
MHRRDFRKRERPSWWPENEAWPPQPHFVRRHPFFRRIGCLFALFNVAGWALAIFIVVSLARALGWVTFGGETPPVDIPAIAGMMIAAVMTIVFVGWGLRRVFSPLDDLVDAAERVADGDYSVRVRERGPRGVGTLARAFNKMASRLDTTQANRRDLLADVTHEMRTPLTVIQGNLEGMIDGVYPADEKNLRALVDETTLLSRLIEDLRTLALAESGALQLKKEPTDLEALIRDVAAAFQGQASSQGVHLAVDVAGDASPVDVDPGRMRQVLTNLLTNALRYTPAGGSVRVNCVRSGADVRIEVQDTGGGIAGEDLPHVFDRFYRSTDSGGMGLGLAIAKHLVEAHGGTITARSALGQGTTMQILVPFASQG